MSIVALEDVKILPGRREPDPQKVEALAESIEAIGLIQPIVIDSNGVLIAGLHRLQACALLGWTEIPCVTREGRPEAFEGIDEDDLGMSPAEADRRLAEIDENLIRNELTALERAEQIAERKKLYQARWPEAAHGGVREGSGRPSTVERPEESKRHGVVLKEVTVQPSATKPEPKPEAVLDPFTDPETGESVWGPPYVPKPIETRPQDAFPTVRRITCEADILSDPEFDPVAYEEAKRIIAEMDAAEARGETYTPTATKRPPAFTADTAAKTGVTRRTVERLAKIGSMPEAIRDAVRGTALEDNAGELRRLAAIKDPETQAEAARRVVSGEAGKVATALQQIKNEARVEKAAASVTSIPGVDLRLCDVAEIVADTSLDGVGLVHADPPWTYDDPRANGAAAKHYKVLDIAEIAAMVDAAYDRAADDCYLLLWCTWPKLGEWITASTDMRWRLVSGGCWAKTGTPGAGHHWRGDSEPLLLYVKGSPKPFNRFFSNTYIGPRTAHSEKPEEWLDGLVATFCPLGGVVMDLFAGRAPLARACAVAGFRYVGAEIDQDRHNAALAALADVL